MNKLNKKKIALFFTVGLSLKKWQTNGNLEREMRIYIELSKQFECIYLFTYGGKNDLKFQNDFPDNIKIYNKNLNIPSIIYSVVLPIYYRNELKKVDILKTNQMYGSWAALITKLIYKKKLVVRCGYEWLNFIENSNSSYMRRKIAFFIENICYKKADKIILTSKSDLNFVKDKFKLSSDKIEIVPNYIDTDLFKPSNEIKNKNKIIYVGRLEKQKNILNLIKAVQDLDVNLIIIGSGSLEHQLKIGSQKSKANIEFKNNISNNDLPKELNRSNVFILPSYYEGCPKVLLEAMSCGLPCIGTNTKGINEIIKHRYNGYLCECNKDSIKEAIIEVLRNNDLQYEMGKNARNTILKKFDLEIILDKEKKIYEML